MSAAAQVSEVLDPTFPTEPNLVLLPPITPSQPVQVPLSGGLRYVDKDVKSLFIGRNYIVFDISEYSNWDELLSKLVPVLVGLKPILQIEHIDNLVLTYINEFLIDEEGFNFEENFNLDISLKNSENADINYRDFFLGFVPFWDESNKIVLRLKCAGIKEQKYQFTLESVCKNSEAIAIEEETLTTKLTEIHGNIEEYFISLIQDTKLSKDIGMFIDDKT